jgi:hypothetical protein
MARIPKTLPKALRPRTISKSISVRIRFRDNVRSNGGMGVGHVSWFRSMTLRKKAFFKRIGSKFASSQNLSEIRTTLLGIINEKVYQAYPDPETRTYRLYNSTSVSRIQRDGYITGFAYYMKDSVAPAKTGEMKGRNYAAFFLKPRELRTFIKPKGRKSPPVNFRDFFGIESDEGTIKAFMQQHSPELASQAILQAVVASVPKKRK